MGGLTCFNNSTKACNSESASFDRNNAVSKLIPNLLASLDDCRNFTS